MAHGSHVRAVGPPSQCSRNLASALEELRRQEDIEWIIEKLEAAGFMEMENDVATAQPSPNGRKKTPTEGASVKAKRQLITRSESGSLPVEGLKWVIRDLRLNTGQNFWKNHVTREDLLKVLLSHFKARQPARHKTGVAPTDTRGGTALTAVKNKRSTSATVTTAAGTTASSFDRIRQGLVSVGHKAGQGTTGEHNATYETPTYVDLLVPHSKGAPRQNARLRRPHSSKPLVRKEWKDFSFDTTEGMLYQTRVGLSRNWRSVKEIALRRACPSTGYHLSTLSLLANFGQCNIDGNAPESEAEPHDPERWESDKREEETKLMLRKCAKSIYELSTRADKGSLMMRNGVLEALSVLSSVEDPRTTRYVGASYVNMAALSPDFCMEMLKNQVVRCLHRLWRSACTMVNHRSGSRLERNGERSGYVNSLAAIETDEGWRIRKCGSDILDQTAVALCRLTMMAGSESIMMHEKGMDAIMWFASDEQHRNERLKVVGLQCLVNFHCNTPTGAFHEVLLPCVRQLGESASTSIRRFAGQAICALGSNKSGASQLLAGGVLTILGRLSRPNNEPASVNSGYEGEGRDHLPADGLLLEACARAASNLTNANTEFVRQALVAPATVSDILDILYHGGDFDTGGGGDDDCSGSRFLAGPSERWRKRAAECRRNNARVLASIFSEADASETARLVELGFLLKLGKFFRQAEAREDPEAQELLAYSMWHVSVSLTDIKPSLPRPLSSSIPVSLSPFLSSGGGQQHQSKGGRRRSSTASYVSVLSSPGGGVRGGAGVTKGSTVSSVACPFLSTAVLEANTAQDSSSAMSGFAVGTPSQPSSEKGKIPALSRKLSTVSRVSSAIGSVRAKAGSTRSAGRGPGTPATKVVGGRRTGKRLSTATQEDVISEGSSQSRGFLEGGVPKELGLALPLDSLLPERNLSLGSEDKVDKRPHVVACGIMDHLLRLAESGKSAFVRECSAGALCNLSRKSWINADIIKEMGILQTLLKAVGIALAHGEEGTSKLAAHGLWNLVSRMSQDKDFIRGCLESGVVGGLCGAAKGAADLLVALDEAATDEVGEAASATGSVADSNQEDADDNNSEELAGDEVFRMHMRATAKACLQSLHAILKHKWVRLDPLLADIKEDLLVMLTSSGVGGTQVTELSTAIMCNLSHDTCCDLALLVKTGALQDTLRKLNSPSRVVLKHMSGVLANVSSCIVSASEDSSSSSMWKEIKGLPIFDALKRLAHVDDQRLSFRVSSILYGLTRKQEYVHIFPDLRGLGEVVFKLFRSGMLQTQNYCLQAFCNMAHNKEFAASIASDQEMMEGFIVGCMVHNNSPYLKGICSEVLYYLLSNPCTRLATLKGQGMWALVQLAASNGSEISMCLAILALFNLACDLRENSKWLTEHTVTEVLDFNDEVLGAPAYTGLVYLVSTHHGRLSQMLVSTRMALEARVKIEGAKFLKRDRDKEEDKKFLARTAAAWRSNEFDDDGTSSSEEEGDDVANKRQRFTDPKRLGTKHKCRLRTAFVTTHLMPTLATVYNLCCKSLTATKLFFHEGVAEAVAGLLEEMRGEEDATLYHPQVEILCSAVLSIMIEDAALLPKLIERRITPVITQGLSSRTIPVQLMSLWSLLLLGIPGPKSNSSNRPAGTTSSSAASVGDNTGVAGLPPRMWIMFCREAVVECRAISALWALWERTEGSLEPEAREKVRYAVFTITRIFLMDKVAASAVVRQRGTELLALTMDFSEVSQGRSALPTFEEDFEYDESTSHIVMVSALCCAVVTVHLSDIVPDSVQSVCEGCLDVFLKILPTDDDEVRDLCSLAMRCLVGNEELLQDLLPDPRLTKLLEMLLDDATHVGGIHIGVILKRVVVLSATPGVPDLSPALVNLTDYVFQRRSPPDAAATDGDLGRNVSILSDASNFQGTLPIARQASVKGTARAVRISLTSPTAGGKTRLAVRPPPSSTHPTRPTISNEGSGSATSRAYRMGRLRATRKASSLGTGFPADSAPSSLVETQRRLGTLTTDTAADAATADLERGTDVVPGAGTESVVGKLDSKFNVFQAVMGGPGKPENAVIDISTQIAKYDEKDNARIRGEAVEGAGFGPAADPAAAPPAVAAAEANGAGSPSEGVAISSMIRASAAKFTGVSGRARMDDKKLIPAQPHLPPTRVGKHDVVGVGHLVGNSSKDKPQESMLAQLSDAEDDDASESTRSSGEGLEITYNEDEIRQVKRLVFRVVEAEMSSTIVQSVAEVVAEVGEVARKQCIMFHERSNVFRKEVLRTRKGQALMLPHSNHLGVDGGGGAGPSSSGASTPSEGGAGGGGNAGATPPSENATGSDEAERLLRRNWNPAEQLLLSTGMEPPRMVPGWEVDSTRSLKGNGKNKVNLCTTKFVDDSKTLASAEVALPIPLPEELMSFTRKGETHMPPGIERCILAPLERPGSEKADSAQQESQERKAAKAAAEAAEAEAAEVEAAEAEAAEEEAATASAAAAATDENGCLSGLNTSSSNGGGRPHRRDRGWRNIKNSVVRKGVLDTFVGDFIGMANRGVPWRQWSFGFEEEGGGGEEGRARRDGPGANELVTREDSTLPYLIDIGRERRRGGGNNDYISNTSYLPSRSLDALFAASPLLVALSFTKGTLSPSPNAMGRGGRARRGVSENRSGVPAAAADTISLRARRQLEDRESGRERQKLLESLKVGTRRTLKPAPGKKGRIKLVTVVPAPEKPPPPSVPLVVPSFRRCPY